MGPQLTAALSECHSISKFGKGALCAIPLPKLPHGVTHSSLPFIQRSKVCRHHAIQ